MLTAMEVDDGIADRAATDIDVAAGAVAELAAAEAEHGDVARRLSPRVVDAMREAGLLRIAQPRRFGGMGRPLADLVRAVEIVARGDGSAGWVFAVLAGHPTSAIDFSLEAQEELWGASADTLISSSFAPVGQLVRTTGGYSLSGDYAFSSGCDFAQWAMVGALPPDTERGGAPPVHCLVPMRDIEIFDDWHTMGLRGTGSRTLRIRDAVIPAHRVTTLPPLEGTPLPFYLLAAMIGMARAAVDLFLERQRHSRPPGRPPAIESELVQAIAGEAATEVEAASILIREATIRAEPHMGPHYPLTLRAELRGLSGLAARLVIQATDRVMAASGGGAILESSRIQRCFRDLHSAAQHMALSPAAAFRQSGVMRLAPEAYRPMM